MRPIEFRHNLKWLQSFPLHSIVIYPPLSVPAPRIFSTERLTEEIMPRKRRHVVHKQRMADRIRVLDNRNSRTVSNFHVLGHENRVIITDEHDSRRDEPTESGKTRRTTENVTGNNLRYLALPSDS